MDYVYREKESSVYSNVQQNVELIIYSLVAFFVPFLIAGPQWFVGTIVNAALVLSAFRIKDYKVLPVVMLPSIAVLARGLVFGNATVFLAYLVPFIWAANALMVLLFKKLRVKKNILYVAALASSAKAGFLFISAVALVALGIIPALFIPAMGIIQLLTAISGSGVAMLVQKSIWKSS